MNNKLIVSLGLLAFTFIFLGAGSVFAGSQLGEYNGSFLSAQELDMSREDFFTYRTEMRENHRNQMLVLRQERLQDAVERGCITLEEMIEKIEVRRNQRKAGGWR